MNAVFVMAAAFALVVWCPLALMGLLWTERVQRWQGRLFRRFPVLCWPYPPDWVEAYFRSRVSYYQTKFAGLVALLMATVVAVASISKLR